MRKNSFVFFLLLLLGGCSKNDAVVNQIPDIQFERRVDLGLPSYQKLNAVGGFAYIDGGYKGVLIYRSSLNEFKAFERSCTYQPLTPCHTVSMDSVSLAMIKCGCCKSLWNMEGQIMANPAVLGLKTYRVQFVSSSSTLYIANP